MAPHTYAFKTQSRKTHRWRRQGSNSKSAPPSTHQYVGAVPDNDGPANHRPANDGWDPTAALAAYADHERRHATIPAPGYSLTWDGDVLQMTGPDDEPWSNGVIYSDLRGDSADAAIAAQIDYFTALGRPFEWKLFDHDQPRDLGERLRHAGLRPEDVKTLVARDVSLPFPISPLLPDVEFVRVDDPANFQNIAHLFGDAADDHHHGKWLAESLGAGKTAAPEALSVYVARGDDAAVVSAGWVRFSDRGLFASLWGGATLPQWRGRGIYTSLVAMRLAEAHKRGYRWITVDCSDQSLPIL